MSRAAAKREREAKMHAEWEKIEQERAEAIRMHGATSHIENMQQFLLRFNDISDQDFANKAFAEAIVYLLEQIREKDIPR